MNSPTLTLYAALQNAFDHFNECLFGGRLPPCLITLRSASRVYGYHHAGRFISPNGKLVDELGIHPGFFTLQPVEVVMATLVHEMVHHWQSHAGTPSPSNPHNREWSEKMISLGLQPSDTGLPGGKKTGRSMSDYILPDGLFLQACRELVAQEFALPWMDRHAPVRPQTQVEHQRALEAAGVLIEMSPVPVSGLPQVVAGEASVREPPPKQPPTRFKFRCAKCETTAWAAADASILCGICGVRLVVGHHQSHTR
jgi:hypothetical protein